MKYRCCFASGVTRIGSDAGISREHACGSPGLPELDDLTRAGRGMPHVADSREPT